jgi:hypothetical protein
VDHRAAAPRLAQEQLLITTFDEPIDFAVAVYPRRRDTLRFIMAALATAGSEGRCDSLLLNLRRAEKPQSATLDLPCNLSPEGVGCKYSCSSRAWLA